MTPRSLTGLPRDPGDGPIPVPVLVSSAPGVEFIEALRPESATRITLPAFEGPLGLLLALIEARQLDVLTVPLGALADAYLGALATLDGSRMEHISAFIAVASQLIVIKSRALLPRRSPDGPQPLADEGADPEADLRARLILYRAYRDAGARLLADARVRVGLFHREPAAAYAAAMAGARAPRTPPLDPGRLVAALDGLARLAPPPPPPPEILPRTITLTERADIIRRALRGAPVIVLQEVLRGARDRVVVAVTFLAMLELVKRREIVVEQGDPWGPIVVRRLTPAERTAAGLGPEADVGELDESLESFA